MIRLLLKILLPLFGAMVVVWSVGFWLYNLGPQFDKRMLQEEFRPLRPKVLTLSVMSLDEALARSFELSQLWDVPLAVEQVPPPAPTLIGDDYSTIYHLGGVFAWDFEFAHRPTIAVIVEIDITDTYLSRYQYYVPLTTPGAWIRIEPVAASELERLKRLDSDFLTQTDRIFILVLGGVAFLIALSFGGYVMLRLKGIRRVLRRIRDGDLTARVSGTGRDLIHQLGHDCDAMAAHLQQLITQQDTMLRMLAHELRTPLARMDLGLHLAERESGSGARLAAVRGEIEHLDRLIQDLTRLIRIEHQVTSEAASCIRIKPEIERMIVGLAAHHPHLALTCEGAEEIEIRGHAALIRVAILNLLSNAARYAKSRVVVGFVRESATVRLWVDDDGSGIPEAERERIFLPFVTLGASSSGGTGLGLAIVQRILTSAGGTALCQASPLGGARFVLCWPHAPLHGSA